MNAYDLDHPLRVDCCDVCGAADWRSCVCLASLPRRQPTPAELERAREARLTRAEAKSAT